MHVGSPRPRPAVYALEIIAAAIALIELWRGLDERKRHKRKLEASRRSEAFMLRRQLRSWLGIEPALQQKLVGWVRLTRSYGTFAGHISNAEERMAKIVMLTAELGGDTTAASAAHQTFLHATNLLTYFDAINPSDHRRPHWETAFQEATDNLGSVIKTLEERFIGDPTLKGALSAPTPLPLPPMDDEG
jgi:hypothetical protein